MASEAPAEPPLAEILPNWLHDGEPFRVVVNDAAKFAGQMVNVTICSMDAVETSFRMSFEMQLDGDGNGEIYLDQGFAIGHPAAVYVHSLHTGSDELPFPDVVMSLVNSEAPGADLEELMIQVNQLHAIQTQTYGVPLGDAQEPGTIEHRALAVIEGLYITATLRIPGAEIRPIEQRPADKERRQIVNDELESLGWPARIPADPWIEAARSRSPMTAIVVPLMWAKDFDEAFTNVRDLVERVIGLLALNRNATGRLVAIVLEQRQPDDSGKSRIYPPSRYYRGNLMGGLISGESQSTLLRQYEASGADPLLRLCCELYAEALADWSIDARFLRLWSILELLSGARIPTDQKVIRRDGTTWPGRYNTTSYAAPRVYHYIREYFDAASLDETSTLHPAGDLYEAVRTWYGRRNATGHYGRLAVSDARQQDQSWYSWAARSVSNESEWIRSLERLVQVVINHELLSVRTAGTESLTD